MSKQDNQTAFVKQITPSNTKPPAPSGKKDPNIVRLPSGRRIELGEQQRKSR